jgi:hypothetical protein
MSNEFDVRYDNVSSKSAPALDDYEKSVFLTRGMYKILDSALSDGVPEGHGKSVEIYKKLIESYYSLDQIGESITRQKLVSNAVFYARNPETYKVLLEQAKLNSDDPLLNGHTAQVVPIPYDRVLRVIRNPFLGAQKDRVIKVDSGLEGVSDIIQLIPPTNATIERYISQIIRTPYPVIVSDLSATFPDETLSIYGKTTPYSAIEATDVSEIVHKEIIEEAVKLAILHYKENSLSNNLQMR